MYVGDPVMQARDLMQDPPNFLSPPTFSASGGVGGGLPSGSYFVVLTAVNQWGETTASAEQEVALSGAQATIAITTWSLPPGTVFSAIRVYVGTAAGGENCYFSFPSPATTPLLIPNLTGAIAQSPQPTNTAYLPDTDGGYMRAAAMFRWLSEGLVQSSRICGGFEDYSGFPSTLNYATYMVTGEWIRMIQAWYDGYPVSFSPTGTFFKRNIVTSSILAGWAVSYYNNQLGIELWPQPDRTAQQTALSAAMGIADNFATCTNVGGFLLPTYGMAKIGSEIVAYNGTSGGTQLVGLIRGLGGTVPQAWPIGTAVFELNAFFQGRRVFTTPYAPGQSMVQVPIPSGFTDILTDFLMAKFYETERDGGMMKQHLDAFTAKIKDFMRQNRQIAGPQQVGSRDYQFIVFGGTRFGANVIP